MPKVHASTQSTNPPHLLDTLAQPWKIEPLNPLKAPLPKAYTANQKTLYYRARYKAITNAVVFKLVDIESPLNKPYWSTYHCTRSILQENGKLTSRYCNQRWCLVCNRIRTANLMRGYLPSIDKMKDPQFVTLTRPNVKGGSLRSTFESMQSKFTQCRDALRKQGITLVGIRKVETTYNDIRDDYHPHFHCIIDGKELSEKLVSQWLKRQPKANRKAQDIRPCKDPIELFKYFTKLWKDDGQFLPKPMDKIFQAMKGKRVFQPFGGIKKQSEDIDVKDETQCDWKDEAIEIWTFESVGKFSDWYNSNGEALSEIELSDDTMNLIEKIGA